MATRPARTVADGVDLSQHVKDPAAMKRAGKDFVVRYLSPDTTNNPQKQLEAGELAAIRAAELAVCVVWETGRSRATDGYGAGQTDAHAADAYREHLGMPDDMPIHWAIDEDLTGAAVEAYARGWASVLGVARCGAYGGIRPLAYLLDRGLITYAWQTYAWSGGELEPRATAYQYDNDETVAGNIVDLDAALAHDYGQWEPGGSPGDRGLIDMTEVDLTPAAIAAVARAVGALKVDDAADSEKSGAGATIKGIIRQLGYRSDQTTNKQLPNLDAEIDALTAGESSQATAISALSGKLDGVPAAVVAALPQVAGGQAGFTDAQLAQVEQAAQAALAHLGLVVTP